MAPIKDVARKAGVSTSTVSKFINGGNLRQEKNRAEVVDFSDYGLANRLT